MSDFDIDKAEQILDEIQEGLKERQKTIQPGECRGCGAYRLDGVQPQIHAPDCPMKERSA